MSRFRHFRCYLDRQPALRGPLRHLSPPGVSRFWLFRSHLTFPPAPRGSLRHLSPPGVSRFRHSRCYLDRPPALRGPLRLTPASRAGSWPGAMAAGAREQAASCDAFVLSRRLPAPDALPSRTSPVCLIARTRSRTLAGPRHGDLWPDRDCRCEFRQARSRTPLPDSVLAVVGMTDGVWPGGSVMSTLRRGSRRAFRHDRG